MIKTNLIARPLSNLADFSLLRDDLFFPVQETFDRFFHDFFNTSALDSVKGRNGYPKMEVGIEGETWVVRCAIPGVREEDLLVQVDETNKNTRLLRVQGQMAEEYQSPEGAQYFVRELRKSKFIREIVLPNGLVGDPEAVIKDGVLTLRWKKPPQDGEGSAAVKRIAIKKE